MLTERKLSERLSAIVEYVSAGTRLLDVGCDHALVPLHLLSENRVSYAIGADLREGPLRAARENARSMGLSDRIDLRLGGGLSVVEPGEADTLVIAGMGGETITGILTEYPATASAFKELILAPQKNAAMLRETLRQLQIAIVDETMVLEDGKYYPILYAKPAERQVPCADDPSLQELEDRFGPILMKKKHPVLLSYLRKRKMQTEAILSNLDGREVNKEDRQYQTLAAEAQAIGRALSVMEDSRT